MAAKKPKVVLDPYGRRRDHIFSSDDLARLSSFAEVVWGQDSPIPDDEMARHQEEVEAIVAGHWHHGPLASFPKLRAFIEVGGGLPSAASMDYQTCFARGIRVLSCAPAFAPAVAEMGLALALASCREVARTDRAFRTGQENWSHEEVGSGFQLGGKPVGFIGYGSIARRLRELIHPFGCPVHAYDPWITPTALRLAGAEPATLEEVLSQSRFIFVLALPTHETDSLLSEALLQLIEPDSVFVLLSRAQIVDFEALTRMALEGRFRVALDVFPSEPLDPHHPIRTCEGAVLSSHRAGAQTEALQNIGKLIVDDLEGILRGLPPQFLQAAQPEIIKLREAR